MLFFSRTRLANIIMPGADYTYRDAFDLVSTVTSPCGVSSVLNIQSDLRVSNSKNTKGSGYIATDSVSLFNLAQGVYNTDNLQIDTALSTVCLHSSSLFI